MKDKFKEYQGAVRFVENLSNVNTGKQYLRDRGNPQIYLKRMRYFLGLLGNPHRGMRFVHVTGTAGKGTVCAMIHASLVASGEKAGLFTSPFCTTSIEKIMICNRYIDPKEFVLIVNEIKPVLNEAYLRSPYGDPSYFETFFAIALLAFHKAKCSTAVIEVGLGGRYDATNVIEKPVVTAITGIDYDHMDILGNTLREIAFDKAGIIKQGSHFFTTEHRPTLLKIFQNVCRENKVPYNTTFPLPYSYRERNMSLVRAIAKDLGISFRATEEGITKARLPCRFEVVQKRPLVILDGAHNPSKIRALLEDLKKLKYRKLILVFGVAASKDGKAMIQLLAPVAAKIFTTRFELGERKCTPPSLIANLARRFSKNGTMIKIFLDPREALELALNIANPHDLVLVAGSFYLTGELRTRWYPEEGVLVHRRSWW